MLMFDVFLVNCWAIKVIFAQKDVRTGIHNGKKNLNFFREENENSK